MTRLISPSQREGEIEIRLWQREGNSCSKGGEFTVLPLSCLMPRRNHLEYAKAALPYFYPKDFPFTQCVFYLLIRTERKRSTVRSQLDNPNLLASYSMYFTAATTLRPYHYNSLPNSTVTMVCSKPSQLERGCSTRLHYSY